MNRRFKNTAFISNKCIYHKCIHFIFINVFLFFYICVYINLQDWSLQRYIYKEQYICSSLTTTPLAAVAHGIMLCVSVHLLNGVLE